MRTVKVNKYDLMRALETNGRKHVEDYEKAMDGYWRTAAEELDKVREQVANKEWDQPNWIIVNLEMPQSHAEEYDTAIEMLDWSTEDDVELTQQEFKQFVQDEWAWKKHFMTTNSTYVG